MVWGAIFLHRLKTGNTLIYVVNTLRVIERKGSYVLFLILTNKGDTSVPGYGFRLVKI